MVVRVTTVAVEKRYYIFRVCVDSVDQRAMRMRQIGICGLSTLQYFSTLCHKWHDFRGGKKRKGGKKITEHRMRFISAINQLETQNYCKTKIVCIKLVNY